jgi:16S rRNA (guanine527-N7)-methyltransferase
MALSALGSSWEPLVRSVVNELSPALSGAVDPSIGRLLDLVCDWNSRVDLTAARSNEELVDLFVADAAVLARESRGQDRAGCRWLDVGSGAGAPGIPLALFLPKLTLTLVEPRAKRVAFLRSALGVLGRPDVQVKRARSEELTGSEHEIASSRATLSPEAWLREGSRLAREAVWVLLAKAELPSLAGWRIDRDVRYRWPLTDVERRALRFVPELHAPG